MSRAQIDLDLRPATTSDSRTVADLETARKPDDPADPAMLRFWWSTTPADGVYTRVIAVREGYAVAYVMARHRPWVDGAERFGSMRILLHPELWSPDRYGGLVDLGETWLRGPRVQRGTARAPVGTGPCRESRRPAGRRRRQPKTDAGTGRPCTQARRRRRSRPLGQAVRDDHCGRAGHPNHRAGTRDAVRRMAPPLV